MLYFLFRLARLAFCHIYFTPPYYPPSPFTLFVPQGGPRANGTRSRAANRTPVVLSRDFTEALQKWAELPTHLTRRWLCDWFGGLVNIAMRRGE